MKNRTKEIHFQSLFIWFPISIHAAHIQEPIFFSVQFNAFLNFVLTELTRFV